MSVVSIPGEIPEALPITANAILLPTFAAISILITIVPLRILSQVRNLAAVVLVGTTMIMNLWAFLNATIWPRDDWANWWNGVGFCDVQATLQSPLDLLLALAICVLMRDLARAVDVDNPRLFETPARRRRRITLDLLCLFGPPITQVPLNYVIQTQRYVIIPVYGCGDSTDTSWPVIVLLSIWPLLVGILGCYYSLVTLFRLRKHRGTISSTLSHNSSRLNSEMFLKLYSMTTLSLVIYLPVSCYLFYADWPNPFTSYSWNRVHDPAVWKDILYLHTADLPDDQYVPWLQVALAFVIFFWYGLTYEAIECYRRILVACGLANIWPVLRESYQPRSRNKSSAAGRSTQSNWSARMDVFEKAAAYLDRSYKKNSQDQLTTASTSEGSQSQSHSASEAGGTGKHSNSKTSTTVNHQDLISPVSSGSFGGGERQVPFADAIESSIPQSSTRGLLSAFRTHINTPFPLFTPYLAAATALPTQPSSSNSNGNNQATHPSPSSTPDLEMQDIRTSPRNVFTPGIINNTVETNIWSGSGTRGTANEDFDPPSSSSPKMGMHAYRERERRRQSKEANSNANVGLAASASASAADDVRGRVAEMAGGVEVRREWRQEEFVEGSSSTSTSTSARS